MVKKTEKVNADTGSVAAQTTLMTKRIEQITNHLKHSSKDHAARRGLLQLVGKRKKLLKYLADQNSEEYLQLIAKLGLRR